MAKFIGSNGLAYLWSKVRAGLELKANQSTTYTKTEVDNKLADGVYLGNTVGTV